MDSLAKKVNQRVIENTKLAGVMPYLYIFLAVIASVVAYVCFMLFSTSSFLLSLLFAVLQYGLLFVILTFVVGPLIYCVSLQVAEASRYSKKKISLCVSGTFPIWLSIRDRISLSQTELLFLGEMTRPGSQRFLPPLNIFWLIRRFLMAQSG